MTTNNRLMFSSSVLVLLPPVRISLCLFPCSTTCLSGGSPPMATSRPSTRLWNWISCRGLTRCSRCRWCGRGQALSPVEKASARTPTPTPPRQLHSPRLALIGCSRLHPSDSALVFKCGSHGSEFPDSLGITRLQKGQCDRRLIWTRRSSSTS